MGAEWSHLSHRAAPAPPATRAFGPRCTAAPGAEPSGPAPRAGVCAEDRAVPTVSACEAPEETEDTVKLTFLSPLYARQGPFACVYVDTSRDVDHPEQAIEARWRQLQEELAEQGADTATTGALARVMGADRDVPGRHGQAVFAAHGRLALAEELPQPPAADRARFTMVPDAMPLALQHAPDIPYAAVAVRRVAGEEPGAARPELEIEIQTGRWPSARVSGGDHALRRVPAGEWRQEAARIAEELAKLAERDGVEAVVVSADARDRAVLVQELPRRMRDLVVGVEGGRAAAPGRALLEEELDELFQGRRSALDRARIETFVARRARGRGTAEGLMGTVEALRRGQAEALLLNRPVQLPVRLWVGMAPKQVGLSEADLGSLGVRSCWEEPADAALIRAVVGTNAELVVVDREELPLADGVGVLLRRRG